jgi:NAD(P)-dependent dehydrogenase (short-subunit alcohol dehydrogenase family)
MSHNLITTPFGPASTAAEVTAGVNLAGRRAVVTGASSGIGQETARALAVAGADVTLAVRDTAAGERAAGAITAAVTAGGGPGTVRVASLDLADRLSVAAFTAAWEGPLHILVNNAGIMATPERRTADGWELQFATNHLGHFALAAGLHVALAGAAGARVVVVSSVGHVNGGIRWDDVNFERRPYDPWEAYAQSKTANVLFAVEAALRWTGNRIAVNALNPGRIAGTGLLGHVDPAALAPQSFDPSGTAGVTAKDIPQGAATSVLLAASPLVEGVSGRYFEDCQEAGPHVAGIRRGVAGYAVDHVNAARLWKLSEDLLATPPPLA